jgi:hypothetical protein
VGWRLAALTSELAISLKGILAPLAIRGTASFRLIWRKIENFPSQENEAQLETQALILNAESPHSEISRQLEPIVAMVMRSHQIENESLFRKELFEKAEEFYRLSSLLAREPATLVWVNRFRFDLAVMASGKVNPVTNVGGEVKLRFEWFRIEPNTTGVPLASPILSEQDQKFREFVEGIAYDAQRISAESFKETGFYPNYLSVGIGMNASGNLGVVKLGGAVMGYLYFGLIQKDLKEIPMPMSLPAGALKPLELTEFHSPKSHVDYAREHHIPFKEVSKYGVVEEVIYLIDRARFRSGLTKACRLSAQMLQRLQTVKAKKWEIREVRSSFELSIGGDLGIVSVNGVGNVGLSFVRR